MRKLFIIVLIYLLYSSTAIAEVIKKINISGNSRVSEETIKIYGGIKINEDYKEKDLNRVLNDLFSTNFFEDVQIELSNNILNINLIEHPIINELIIIGEPAEKYIEQIRKIIKSKEKDSYIKNNIAKDINIIKRLYASAGYNFAQVDTKVRKIDKSNLDLIFEITKGEETRISKITFVGDKKIRDKRLRDIVASEEHKFWKIISRNTKFNQNLVNMDKRLLENYYRSIGYYDVQIKSNSAEINKKDGNIAKANQTILEIIGNAGDILTCERTVLNLLSRMCGIATQTNNLKKQIKPGGSKSKIFATRKTAPGLRFFDKEAVKIGGGEKHRMTLNEMIMIKDNHLAVEKSIERILKKAKKTRGKIEIEVESQKEAILCARLGADIIMLDNFSPDRIKKTIKKLTELRLRNKVILEASGRINSKNIARYARTNVDMISVGNVTNSVDGIDLSLEIS